MDKQSKVDSVRAWMAEKKLDAVIIPSADPHGSEYLAEFWQVRKWLTGFSGSAGTCVVTQDRAILWTDFRYWVQAEKEIKDSGFELFKLGEPDVLNPQEWLSENMTKDQIIGIDGNMISTANARQYQAAFEARQLVLKIDVDPAADLWTTGRPDIPLSKAYDFPKTYSGKTRAEKLAAIREKMSKFGATCHVVATLDDIAWTLNLRGRDVHTNPVNIAFMLLYQTRVTLFIRPEKVDPELESALGKDSVSIAPYEQISAALSQLEDQAVLLLDPDNTNFRLYSAVNENCRIIEKPNPSILLKAVKNEVEIAHLKDTQIKDGAAVVKFLHWLENQEKTVTEVTAADALYRFRRQDPLFVDNSFDPIMAFGEHSAMCHYSATKETDVPVRKTGMFLTDSGGNYLTGTTDITRTVSRGNPDPKEIRDYTLVLKGHIAVAVTPFPKGTRGVQIDTLARQALWQAGMDFGHGTGHGVGFFLCVHEGPARISPHPVDVKLEKGMVLTNEPGVYREGAWGIRLENMILVIEAFENEFGPFLKFETLTLCHLETGLMDKTLLTREEIDWVNAYHKQVCEKLSPVLDPPVAAWLKQKTRPI